MNENQILNYVEGIAAEEKQVLIYDRDNAYSKIKVYNGTEEIEMTSNEFKKLNQAERYGRGDYVLIRSLKNPTKPMKNKDGKVILDEKTRKVKTIAITLKEQYEGFVKNAEIMKLETKGKVNMFKSGTVSKSSKHLFFQMMNKSKIFPDDITREESDFLRNARGGLIFGEKYEGEAYKYDVNSFYPSLYSSRYLLIPIREGEIQTLTQNEFKTMTPKRMGMYRAKLTAPTVDNIDKLFRLDRNDYYTHYELNYASELNYKMEIIQDGKPNFLYYSRDKCLTGSEVFGEFVKTMYPLKKRGIAIAKEFLNTLAGALCEERVFHLTFDPTKDELIIKEDREMVSGVMEKSPTCYKVDVIDPNKRFEYNWARMKPFLTAKGRVTIAKIMQPYISNIKRCHTDGFISDVKLPIKHSEELAKIKYEGYCKNVEIINSRDVLGEFLKF